MTKFDVQVQSDEFASRAEEFALAMLWDEFWAEVRAAEAEKKRLSQDDAKE